MSGVTHINYELFIVYVGYSTLAPNPSIIESENWIFRMYGHDGPVPSLYTVPMIQHNSPKISTNAYILMDYSAPSIYTVERYLLLYIHQCFH